MSEWIYPPEPRPNNAIGFTYIIINEKTMRCYPGMKTFVKGWEGYYGSCKILLAEIQTYKDKGEEPPYTRGIIRWHTDRAELAEHEANLQKGLDVLHSTFEDGSRMFYNGNINGKVAPGHNKGRKLGPNSKMGRKKGHIPWSKGLHPGQTPKQVAACIARRGKPTKPASDERKRKIAESNTGKTRSEESKRKQRETNKGKPWTQARKDAQANKKFLKDQPPKQKKGRAKSEETKRKQSEANKGKRWSQTRRSKKIKPFSDQARINLRAGQKKRREREKLL